MLTGANSQYIKSIHSAARKHTGNVVIYRIGFVLQMLFVFSDVCMLCLRLGSKTVSTSVIGRFCLTDGRILTVAVWWRFNDYDVSTSSSKMKSEVFINLCLCVTFKMAGHSGQGFQQNLEIMFV